MPMRSDFKNDGSLRKGSAIAARVVLCIKSRRFISDKLSEIGDIGKRLRANRRGLYAYSPTMSAPILPAGSPSIDSSYSYVRPVPPRSREGPAPGW